MSYKNFKFKYVWIVSLLALVSHQMVYAIYPSASVKVHNAKLLSHNKVTLNNEWLQYIEEFPEVLRPKDKPYKVDQFCSYSLELDTEGLIKLDSLKLLKHDKNFAYNLKAIQFLRENDLKLHRKNFAKQVEIEFVYLSF